MGNELTSYRDSSVENRFLLSTAVFMVNSTLENEIWLATVEN